MLRWIEHEGHMAVVPTRFQRLLLGSRAQAHGKHYGENDFPSPGSEDRGEVILTVERLEAHDAVAIREPLPDRSRAAR